jgi:hypothetical protein
VPVRLGAVAELMNGKRMGQRSGGRDARLVSWAAFVGGTVASVAANVAHARIPPADAGPAWHPELGAQIAAAFWPLALLGAIEVLTRVPWPRGGVWALARYAGAGAVGAGAAVLSYRHMAALLAAWGEDRWNAHIGPLVVDGLMVVAGTALLALSKGQAVVDEKPAVADPLEQTTSSSETASWPARTAEPAPPLEPAPRAEPTTEVFPAIGAHQPSATDHAGVSAVEQRFALQGMSDQERRERAKADYRRALDRGEDLSPAELAERYGRTVRWATQQCRTVREEWADEQQRRLRAVHD